MENLWIVLALVCAFSLATSDAFTKRALSVHNEYLIAWLRLLLCLPFLLISFFFIGIPTLDRHFYKAFIIALPLEILAMVLYMKALKVSPLSLTLPFLSLTPVFLIIVPSMLLGEKVSSAGAAGVLLIALGSYILNVGEFRKGFFEPFAALRREKGSLFMIAVAFLYSLTSSLGKMAIEHSSALFFGITYFTVLVIFFTPLALYKGRDELDAVFKGGALRASIIPGVFYALMVITHMTALSMTKVAYMISVKRLSLLVGVYYGYLFFDEPGIRGRLLGTALMVLGFVLITVFR